MALLPGLEQHSDLGGIAEYLPCEIVRREYRGDYQRLVCGVRRFYAGAAAQRRTQRDRGDCREYLLYFHLLSLSFCSC